MLLILSLQVNARKKAFLRIYLLGSVNTIAGFYGGHTDSAVILTHAQRSDTVSYARIATIRQGRRTGHYILLSSLIGTVAGAITGLVTHKDPPPSDPNCIICPIFNAFELTAGEDAVAGGFLGLVAGTVTGTVIGAATKNLKLNISGNYETWRRIVPVLDTLPLYPVR